MAHPIDINRRPPGPAKMVTVESFVGVVVVMCPCGNRRPVTVPVIPQAGGVGQCPLCQVNWRVERIEYEEIYGKPGEEVQPAKCNIRMQGIVPTILIPPNGGERRIVG